MFVQHAGRKDGWPPPCTLAGSHLGHNPIFSMEGDWGALQAPNHHIVWTCVQLGNITPSSEHYQAGKGASSLSSEIHLTPWPGMRGGVYGTGQAGPPHFCHICHHSPKTIFLVFSGDGKYFKTYVQEEQDMSQIREEDVQRWAYSSWSGSHIKRL